MHRGKSIASVVATLFSYRVRACLPNMPNRGFNGCVHVDCHGIVAVLLYYLVVYVRFARDYNAHACDLFQLWVYVDMGVGESQNSASCIEKVESWVNFITIMVVPQVPLI